MNIKATFPAGVDTLTVHGLHQWDYGRKLEISAPNLPALVEVHFACAGQKDAVVRLASVAGGVASVIIPDTCLEQTTPVAAWVYEVGDTYGHTALTVILPVTARAKPTAATLPVAIGDKYTELIGLVNKCLQQLADGTITVKNAASATYAGTANLAMYASMDGRGNNITATYGNFTRPWITTSPTARINLPGPGVYQVMSGDKRCNCIIYWDGTTMDVTYDMDAVGGMSRHVLRIYATGEVSVGRMDVGTETFTEHSVIVKYRALWTEASAAEAAEIETKEV